MHEPSRARFPSIGAALSFLFPGLGQAYARQPRLALVLAAPMVLLVAGVMAAVLVTTDQVRVALFNPRFLIALVVLDVVLLAWRLFAIAHAGLARPASGASTARELRSRAGALVASQAGASAAGGVTSLPVPGPDIGPAVPRRRRWELALVAVLLVATVAMHAWTGLVITSLSSSLDQIFGGSGGERQGPATGPLNEPNYHWDGTARISFLLLGIDSGPYRSEALTDTILVVSIDPVKHDAVMISIPRDTGYLPLPDRRIYADGRYPDKINSLSTVASKNPRLWCPDLASARSCGIRTLQRSIGLYLGITINYYATVNLQGFADLIDALGWVRICLPGKLVDPTYKNPSGTGRPGVTLLPGCHEYNGLKALAYARIRKGTIELPNGTIVPQNDFTRASRQQALLLALRSKFAAANWILALPDVLHAVGETVSTDFPRQDAGDLASLLPLISGDAVKRVVLSSPEYTVLGPNPQVNYLLVPKREVVRAEMARLFGGPLIGWYLGSTASVPPATR